MVPEPRSAYALRFFFLSVGLLSLAFLAAWGLLSLFPPVSSGRANRFSAAFLISTWLLLIESGYLLKAVESVRRERQRAFRRSLAFALAAGTSFVAVQSYALICLFVRQSPGEVSTGAAPFIAVIASLHAMHFIVALLFLSFITVQAHADRYDHEYFWGVKIAAWFCHTLGIVWIVILFVMLIARIYE